MSKSDSDSNTAASADGEQCDTTTKNAQTDLDTEDLSKSINGIDINDDHDNDNGSSNTINTVVVKGLKTDPQTSLPVGCDHYERRCAIICPDESCSQVFVCRLCHDDEVTEHSLNRHDVKKIVCLKCNKIQDANSQSCESCKEQFASYFCKVCHLYDFKDKKQFHCDECGICRVGGRDKYFHCDICTICLSIELKGKHTCVEKAGKNNCPVCMEDLHSSVKGAKPLKCGHMIHLPCFKSLVEKGFFTCPICNKSVDDMSEMWRGMDALIRQQTMPREFRGLKCNLQCRDCNKAGVADFHFTGLKCPSCGSYNTTDEGIVPGDGDGQDDEENEEEEDFAFDLPALVDEDGNIVHDDNDGGDDGGDDNDDENNDGGDDDGDDDDDEDNDGGDDDSDDGDEDNDCGGDDADDDGDEDNDCGDDDADDDVDEDNDCGEDGDEDNDCDDDDADDDGDEDNDGGHDDGDDGNDEDNDGGDDDGDDDGEGDYDGGVDDGGGDDDDDDKNDEDDNDDDDNVLVNDIIDDDVLILIMMMFMMMLTIIDDDVKDDDDDDDQWEDVEDDYGEQDIAA